MNLAAAFTAIFVAIALALPACTDPEVFETPIGFENNGNVCGAEIDGKPRPMDTAVLLIEEARSPNCGNCSGGACERVALVCRCAPPKEVTVGGLAELMAGLRVQAVDPMRSYCITIAALETGHGKKSTGDCDCQDDWLEAARFASAGRICGGARGSIDPEGFELTINCRDNGRDIDISGCLGER